MPPHPTTRPAPRPLFVLIAVALTAALAGVTVTAAQAGPTPTPPVTISVTDVQSSVVPPVTPGAPADLLVAGESFAVVVSFTDSSGALTPISENKSVTLEVSATGGPSFTNVAATKLVVPKGALGGTFTGLALDRASNDVVLSVRATAPAREVTGVVAGVSATLPVARDFASFKIAGVGGATVSKQGVGLPCTATPEQQTCVDLVLPASAGNGDQAFFSTGVCSASLIGCRPGVDVLQVLARFELPKTAPATMIVKCDKTLCGGGAIVDNVLKVSLAPVGPLGEAPPCATKGVIGADQETCVDYVQSKRDGSGDTHLYWLVPRDARMSH